MRGRRIRIAAALERTVAKLEGGSAAFVFTSGMAAIDSVFRLLRPGDHAIISRRFMAASSG